MTTTAITIDPALAQMFQSGALVSVVIFLIGILRPFLERYAPFAAPSANTHDATLRALNLLVNVGLAVTCAWTLHDLSSSQQVLAAIGFGVAQATGSHVIYDTAHARQQQQRGASVASVASPVTGAAAPSSASSSAPPPFSLATLAAPSAAAVAEAVNAAIAAHTS